MTDSTEKAQTNRVHDLVDALFEGGRGEELEEELERLDLAPLDEHERAAWHQFWGVTAFRRGDRPEAFRRFERGHAAFPGSLDLCYSLAQELQHVGRVDEAFVLFDACDDESLSADHAMAATRYAYLWGELDRGVAYLARIVAAYDRLGIVDDHFLYVRNLPSFGVTWATLGALHELRGTLDELAAYTDRAAKTLSDHDFEPLAVFLSRIRSGDLGPSVDELAASIARSQEQGHAVGYRAMQHAVLIAVTAPAAEAHGRLDAVALTDRDFPWLEDIRTLAHAAVAHRAGEEAREAALVERFRERQPLLFEPHHAFDFRLLAYQEVVRAQVQADGRARGGGHETGA